jgi:NADPH-dependent ferric siderophore reductase
MTAKPPETSAFALVRRGLDLRFRSAILAERAWENDAYIRLRLRGNEFVGFDSPGSDDHLRLFFPEGPVRSVEEMRAAPSREYTPLAWGDDWLDIEFAIHGAPGDRGVAAEWAATAALGATVGVGGPRGSMLIEGTPDAWFLAGDETAVPAMRRFAATMAADAVGEIVVEVTDARHALPIDVPPGVRLVHVLRDGRPGGTALAERLDAIPAHARPAGDIFAFIASEQSIVKPARALLIDRWGREPERIVAKGYWKRGDAAFHAPH